MLRAGGLSRRSLRWGAILLVSLTLVSAVTIDPADARSRRHRRAAHATPYNPPYAAMVVDANTGAILHAANADSPRHPASLTKIMTLFLLFERLEAGKIKLSTELPVSPHAAAQAPSKLALKPGDSITVENAIRAIVTKSANDVAVIVAEAVGGDEESFARQMTQKANALGMKNTLYRNASGLPDPEQITTARDQILLGRAIQDRFSRYYRYFSTRAFVFRGKTMKNHNKLLGSVAGVDGIKTGYTNASGFNLVSSARRGNRHMVAAVFGGRTASWRDARMRDLIAQTVVKASLTRTAPPIYDENAAEVAPKRKDSDTDKQRVGSGGSTANAVIVPSPRPDTPDSSEPIRAAAIKTVTVRAASLDNKFIATAPAPRAELVRMAAADKRAKVTTIKTIKTETMATVADKSVNSSSTSQARAIDEAAEAARNAAIKRGDWLIQVGAFDAEAEAKQRLATAQNKAKDVLKEAHPYTESVKKGDKTLYRARFAGFEKTQAESACKSLRRGEIPCMLLKN